MKICLAVRASECRTRGETMRRTLDLDFEKLKPRSTQTRSHYGNNQWTSNSPKLGRALFLQSDLEYDHWIGCVESDPSITHFCEHPLRVCVNVDGKDVVTIFDMIVRNGAGEWEFREVKYIDQLRSDERTIVQTTAQRIWCDIHHVKYRIMTEKEIRRNPLWLHNWKTIVGYLNTVSSAALDRHRDHVRQVLAANSPIPINAVQKILAPLDAQLVATIVFELIHRGECTGLLDTTPANGRLVVSV